jgi:hypothetical protein
VSQGEAYRYHVWSDVPGKWKLTQKYGAQAPHSARDIAVEIKSIQALVALFGGWTRAGERIKELDFHVHGGDGHISLGADYLDLVTLRQFRNQGFDRVFVQNAEISFLSCNVANGPSGECFLAEVGETFLRSSGGVVTANTASGAPDPFGWLSEKRFWPLPHGTWVTARVTPGGSVSLSGHRWLHPDRLREVAAQLEQIVHKQIDTAEGQSLMKGWIQPCWKLLGRHASDRPPYRRILDAWDKLDHAAKRIEAHGWR